MAAVTNPSPVQVCELRQIPVVELGKLLEEEARAWEHDLSWDFHASAELVKRFVQIQSLEGFALRAHGELIGYTYQVCDEHKGLIGDFFVRPTLQSRTNEMALLEAVVENLIRTPGIRRIESQLMLLRPDENQEFPFSKFLTRHDRFFMEIDEAAVLNLPTRNTSYRVRLQSWQDRMQEEAAHVIAASYRGHVDSEINDQYRNIPGARRFLTNIVRYPGCGRFSAAGSVAAIDEQTGRVCGICLSSMVSPHAGHITQVCVLPGIRGTRIGYELMRASLNRLVEAGCLTISLTVTATNISAVRLYESLGFRFKAGFPALVWEDFK